MSETVVNRAGMSKETEVARSWEVHSRSAMIPKERLKRGKVRARTTRGFSSDQSPILGKFTSTRVIYYDLLSTYN